MSKMGRKFFVIRSAFLLLIVGLFQMQTCLGQDFYLSQGYAAPLYLSPSFAGLTNGSRIALSYRDQWPGIPNTYKNFSFSIDHFFENYKSGVGLLMLRDDAGGGQLVNQNIGLLYSYEFEVMRNIFVRPGIQFKYSERITDASKQTYYDQLGNPSGAGGVNGSIVSLDTDNTRKFDATVSGMIYSDFFWFGLTIDNLIKSNIGFTDIDTRKPVKTTVFGGYKYKYRDGYRNKDEQSVTIALNYFAQQSFSQMDAGVYWYINPMELGLVYRGIPILAPKALSNRDALIFIAGFNFGSMRFAYSYDLSMSGLAGSSNGANEFSFIYRFNQTYKKRIYRGSVPCSEPGVSVLGGSKYSKKTRKIF